jgi:hypothetical protein
MEYSLKTVLVLRRPLFLVFLLPRCFPYHPFPLEGLSAGPEATAIAAAVAAAAVIVAVATIAATAAAATAAGI